MANALLTSLGLAPLMAGIPRGLEFLDKPRQLAWQQLQNWGLLPEGTNTGADFLANVLGMDRDSALTRGLGILPEMVLDPLNLAIPFAGAGLSRALRGGEAALAARAGEKAGAMGELGRMMGLASDAEMSAKAAMMSKEAALAEAARLRQLVPEFERASELQRMANVRAADRYNTISQETMGIPEGRFLPEPQPRTWQGLPTMQVGEGGTVVGEVADIGRAAGSGGTMRSSALTGEGSKRIRRPKRDLTQEALDRGIGFVNQRGELEMLPGRVYYDPLKPGTTKVLAHEIVDPRGGVGFLNPNVSSEVLPVKPFAGYKTKSGVPRPAPGGYEEFPVLPAERLYGQAARDAALAAEAATRRATGPQGFQTMESIWRDMALRRRAGQESLLRRIGQLSDPSAVGLMEGLSLQGLDSPLARAVLAGLGGGAAFGAGSALFGE